MSENEVNMVWVQKQVIMCLFVTFVSLRAKRPKLVTVIFLSFIKVKQQQNDRKLYAKDMGEKRSHLGLVFICENFCAQGCVLWLQAIFNRINGKQH